MDIKLDFFKEFSWFEYNKIQTPVMTISDMDACIMIRVDYLMIKVPFVL